MDDLDRAFGGVYRVKPIGFMNIIFSPLVLIGSLPNKCLGLGTAKQNRRVCMAFHLEWLVYKISMPRISHKSEQIQPIQLEGPSFCSTNFGSVPLVVAITSNTCQNAPKLLTKISPYDNLSLIHSLILLFGGSIRWEFEKHRLIHYPFSTKLINHHVLGLARPWSSSDLVTRGGNAAIIVRKSSDI